MPDAQAQTPATGPSAAANAPLRGEPADAARVEPSVADRQITDVWSWTGRKYRIRATVALLINLLLFSGLCVFTHWLHVVQPFQFELSSYFAPLRFWGAETQNLYDFILFPISVDQTPVYGIIIGLLLASIVAVPISVSILYRLGCALPFCAAVLVFAHLPWMAVTLVASCILASVRPFRMSFRYGAALLSLLPVLLYLYLATRGATESLGASFSPEHKLLLNYPWLLAILAASMMLAVIIFLARVVRYRPGAVAPVMAVMFATPAVLFHAYIGVDELIYRVIEPTYGPRSKPFEPVQDATDEVLDLVRRRAEHGVNRAAQTAVLLALSSDRPAEQLATIKRRIANHLLVQLMKDRHRAYEACKDFIADHPTSRYVPAVLFMQARALDTRLDEVKFVGETVRRELYTDFPHVQSEPVWTTLLTQYPDSSLAVAARLRVAQLRLRKGDAAGALDALETPAQAVRAESGDSPPREARPAKTTLDFQAEPYLFEIDRLRELIRNNLPQTGDPAEAVKPLQSLASLDPHRRGYLDQLRRLASEYAGTLAHDNIVVRWASAHADRAARARLLRAYLAAAPRFPDDDAVAEALLELADLELHALGNGDEQTREQGIAHLRAVIERFPETCWAKLAAARLELHVPPARPATHPAVSP